jgi:hypothetical protein
MMPYAWRRSRASSRPASWSETGGAPPAAADRAACAAAIVSGAVASSATFATSDVSACSLAWAPADKIHICRQLRSRDASTTNDIAWLKQWWAGVESLCMLRSAAAALTCIRYSRQPKGADLGQEAKCCMLLASKVQPG